MQKAAYRDNRLIETPIFARDEWDGISRPIDDNSTVISASRVSCQLAIYGTFAIPYVAPEASLQKRIK